MLDNSFDGLCRRMQGKSITRGWDAVVTMNRTKVNALFEQQYIDRINKYSFIERITGSHPIDTSGYAVLELSGLILSQPLLSFENASLANSRARLTFRVEAGTVNQRLKLPGAPERVTSSFVVSPQQGFEVHADIDDRVLLHDLPACRLLGRPAQASVQRLRLHQGPDRGLDGRQDDALHAVVYLARPVDPVCR